MKKFFKYLGIVLGIIVLIIIAGATFIQVRGIPRYESNKIVYKVEITPQRIEKGKKLALLLCANCHTNPETGLLTGAQMHDVPAEFGKVFSQNITQDKQYGIATWTDGELLQLLRTGIKRDGNYAPPYMIKLPHMADEDIASIIAFLRSDDPMVKASATKDQPCEPTFLTKFLCTVAFKPLPMPDHKIALPDTNNKVALGKYLVFNLGCFSCHSADFKTNNELEPEKSAGYMGGGNKPLSMDGTPVPTLNISPDKETGIGIWSEDKFVKAVKTGLLDDQPALRYPMVPYVHLSDLEAKAIYAYIQTIPPIKNKVQRAPFD